MEGLLSTESSLGAFYVVFSILCHTVYSVKTIKKTKKTYANKLKKEEEKIKNVILMKKFTKKKESFFQIFKFLFENFQNKKSTTNLCIKKKLFYYSSGLTN